MIGKTARSALLAAGTLALGVSSASAFAPSAFVTPSTRSTAAVSSSRSSLSTVLAVGAVAAPPTSETSAAEPEKSGGGKKRGGRQRRGGRRGSGVTTKATAGANGKRRTPKTGKSGKNAKRGRGGGANGKSMLGRTRRSASRKGELRPLSDLKLGQTISGFVAGITDFGAFVKTSYRLKDDEVGYALLHISQISDDRIENVSDVLKVGQELKDLRVIDINYAKGEVGLSLRPKRKKRFSLGEVKTGEEMEGRVTAVMPYGAFVDVGCKVNALLHKSRISTEPVDNVEEHIKEGDWIKVHVIDVDLEKRTMAASVLERKADEYLDRRKRQAEVRAQRAAVDAFEGDVEEEKDSVAIEKELQFFEEAIRELEEAFK